jgi:hypothetical protein
MRLLSIPQVADALNKSQDYGKVTPSLVRRWCRAGRLGIKVGGHWIITGAELEAFEETRRGPGRPKKAKGQVGSL